MPVTVTTGQPHYVRGTSGFFKGNLTDLATLLCLGLIEIKKLDAGKQDKQKITTARYHNG